MTNKEIRELILSLLDVREQGNFASVEEYKAINKVICYLINNTK